MDNHGHIDGYFLLRLDALPPPPLSIFDYGVIVEAHVMLDIPLLFEKARSMCLIHIKKPPQ